MSRGRGWQRFTLILFWASLAAALAIGVAVWYSYYWPQRYGFVYWLHDFQEDESIYLIYGHFVVKNDAWPESETIPGRRYFVTEGWSSADALEQRSKICISLWPVFWIALAGCLLSATRWARYFRRRQRRRNGLCENCAYDLRGNINGKCPECGAAVPEGLKASLQAEEE